MVFDFDEVCMRLRHWLTATFILPVLLIAPASAQHIADPAAVRQVVTDVEAVDSVNRAIVRRALEHQDVRAAAERWGINLSDAAASVDRLSGAELAELAAPARSIAAAQSGGSNTTIVISITTLLLLLILLVLILK